MAASSNRAESIIQSLDGELVCGVCLEHFEVPVMLPCGHNFCRKCVISIIDSGISFSYFAVGPPNAFNCPLCQVNISLKKYDIDSLPVNRALESIVEVYRTASPVDVFDSAWNADIEVAILNCDLHKLPVDRFCDSCNVIVCKLCEKEKHHGGQKVRHRVESLRQAHANYQTEIADMLTTIKKNSIPLNDRIQTLEDMLSGIDKNEDLVTKQLDHHINALMSLLRQQQDEMKRCLQNEVTDIRRPVTEELNKCKGIKTSVQEMMKKLSTIKCNRNPYSRIKLMKDVRSQLNKLLCFDISWCLQEQMMPEVTMPTWELDTQPVIDSVHTLHWKHNALTPSKSKSSQTMDKNDMPKITATDREDLGDGILATDQHFGSSNEGPSTPEEVPTSSDLPEINIENQNDVESSPQTESNRPETELVSMSFDEHDGRDLRSDEIPTPEDIVPVGNIRNVTFERRDLAKNQMTTDNTRSESPIPTVEISNDENVESLVSERLKSLQVTEKVKTVSGGSSFPMESDRNVRSNAKKENGNRPKPSRTSPSTTHEALAHFVARRKTISPARFSPRSSDNARLNSSEIVGNRAIDGNQSITMETAAMETTGSRSPEGQHDGGHLSRSFSKQPISKSLDFNLDSPT